MLIICYTYFQAAQFPICFGGAAMGYDIQPYIRTWYYMAYGTVMRGCATWCRRYKLWDIDFKWAQGGPS